MNARNLTIIIVAAVIAGALGFHFGGTQSPSMGGGAEQADSGERKIAYWVAPMDANYRRDEPGKSPMGMDLVPVYEDEVNGSAADDADAVRLSPAVVQNFGVRTAQVQQGPFSRRIETVGYIDYDESLITHLHMRADGWIEKLYVHSIGERVKKGDLLFEIYAPALVNAQGDYLNALRSGRDELIRASKERLRALGIPESQISEITKTRKATQRIKFFAPQDGVIAALNMADGMYLTPKVAAVSLADLAKVWLLVDVFETQAELVTEGLKAQVRLSYKPGHAWNGKITYIYPQIDPETRTLKARLEFDNPGEALKPGMYADVTIMGAQKENTLQIPREALIRTGNSERVILALGDGKFRPAAVKAGAESGDKVEILSGLEAGETVVTSAQFLIDSEASFSGTAMRMSGMDKMDGMDGMDSKETMDGTMKGMEDMQDMDKKDSKPTYWAEGQLHKVDEGTGRLNMTHQPIEALGWPMMTMDFLIGPGLETGDLPMDTDIRFKIRKSDSGMYEVLEIQPATQDMQNKQDGEHMHHDMEHE